jgi:hypothetical protein
VRLQNKDNTGFELNILKYEFPEEESAQYDSNWLMIEISVNHPKGEWQSSDPSLLTYEAKAIADWLEKIAANEIAEKTLSFIEPNLSFELQDDKKHFRIYFELESRPSWAASDAAGEKDLWLEIEIDGENLLEAAEDLRRQLNKFPQRAIV